MVIERAYPKRKGTDELNTPFHVHDFMGRTASLIIRGKDDVGGSHTHIT